MASPEATAYPCLRLAPAWGYMSRTDPAGLLPIHAGHPLPQTLCSLTLEQLGPHCREQVLRVLSCQGPCHFLLGEAVMAETRDLCSLPSAQEVESHPLTCIVQSHGEKSVRAFGRPEDTAASPRPLLSDNSLRRIWDREWGADAHCLGTVEASRAGTPQKKHPRIQDMCV